MAKELSRAERLKQLRAGGAGREALLNPVTDTETFVNELSVAGTGAAENVTNLFGNLYNIYTKGEGSVAVKAAEQLPSKGLNPLEMAWEIGKLPFQDFNPNDKNVIESMRKMATDEQKRLSDKSELGAQYSGGGFGEAAAEIVKALPIMRFGTMAKTTEAIAGSKSAVDIAKAISSDSIRNAFSMGASEFALSKAYGESDEMATEKGLIAGGFGLAGTPVIGLAMRGLKGVDNTIVEGEELMAQQAGGGRPPSLTEVGRKEMRSTKEDSGEELPNQVKVETPKIEKFDESFDDDRGRNYSSSWLNSYQGKSTDKAAVVKLPEGNIKDTNAYINSMQKSFKSHIDTIETYGGSDPKFKSKGQMTNAEKKLAEVAFKKDLLFTLSKDKRLKIAEKRELRLQAENLNSKLKVMEDTMSSISEEVAKKTKVKFGSQNVEYSTPIVHNVEMSKQWDIIKSSSKKEYEGFGWSNNVKDMDDNARAEFITKNIESKQDKEEFVKAVDFMETKARTYGGSFDIDNISGSLKKDNPDVVYKIEDYINRQNDLQMFNDGKISQKELSFRESKRIDESNKRDNIIGNKFNSEEELAQAIESKAKAYEDIGMYKKPDEFKIKENKLGEKTVFEESADDVKKRGMARAKKLKAMDNFRKDFDESKLDRYVSGNRKGETVLTKTEIEDIKTFGDVLTNEEILNKTMPDVPRDKRKEVTQKAKQLAKDRIKKRQAKKLGIDFSFLPKNITFTQTIMDAKNSMGQIASVITGSKELADKIMVRAGEKELRGIIGEKLGPLLGLKLGKDEIKTPFMIKGYGSERKGLARTVMAENDFLKTEDDAFKFIDTFNEVFAQEAKELDELMNFIKKIHSERTDPIYKWKMDDGYEVKFDLSEYKDYIIKDSQGDGLTKVKSNTVDKMSRALLPNIFHSFDGYIARQMREKMGIHSTHDAFHIPAGKEVVAQEVYRDILRDINDKNMLGDIFEQLGYKGWKKSGKLDDEYFSYDRQLLGEEHYAFEPELAERLKPSAGKQMTSAEVMRDFFTTSSHRNHEYFKMVDAMIDEAVISKHNLGIARDNDDIFERALAYAFQDNQYGTAKMIDPPVDSKVDKKMWYKEQANIFKEFRAKVELNPSLKDSVKGERLYFTESGEVIGASVRSQREIRKEVLREVHNSQVKLMNDGNAIVNRNTLRGDNLLTHKKIKSGDVSTVTQNDVDKLAIEASLVPKELDIVKAKAMDDAEIKTTLFDRYVKTPLTDSMTHVKEKYKDTPAYKQYQKALGIMKNPQQAAEQSGDNLKKYVDTLLKDKDQTEYTKYLFETDSQAIRDIPNRVEAKKFFDKNMDIYTKAKPAIDQLAKAIGREEHQVGAFLNNPSAIAKRYGINSNRVDDLDRLVSLKAMEQNSAWDFYEKLYGTSEFNILMDIAESQKARSMKHFGHSSSQHKYVKGYIAEYYDSGKSITEDGKVIWDAESKFEDGALGIDLKNNKVGKAEDEAIDPNLFDSEAQMIDFALKNNLKITDKGWRKIPSAKIKNEAGRSNWLSDRLGTTEASIEKKTAQYNSAVRILTDEGAYKDLFSNVPIKGFIEVTDDQRSRLPYLMQEEVKYVNKDYADKLLGRKEVRAISEDASQHAKIADKLVTNLVTLFKQAVVLKNPASYKSALLVNFTTNALIDGNVMKATRNAKKSYSIYQDYKNLIEEYDVAKATSKDITELGKKLKNNELQKYLDLGLSINTLDGVRGQSSLLTHLISDTFGNRIDKVMNVKPMKPGADRVANELMFNQRGTSGNITKNVFSYIDFQGRYMAIKSLENNGISSADAVRRANDLFGQMDGMAPAFVQIIDKYGAFVFAKWFASVAPATMKAAKQNPKKALALTLGLYYASDYSDIMLSNISPVEGVIDMGESGATGDSFIWDRKMATSIIPGVYRDLFKQANYYATPSEHWKGSPAILFKNRLEPWTNKEGETVDFRGVTQKVLDYANE